MSAETKEAASPVWDSQELLGRVENDPELLQEILGLFKVEFPRNLHALELAVASGDLKKSATLSHTLKGMLSNLAAHRASAASAKLEQLCAAGNGGALAGALGELQAEAAVLLPHLDAYIAEVQR